ncbi:hypothetical protein COX94_02160, partial [Candidatus Nomurabacteria bacterium CG_4_10_14_0_2_um_filter_33_9]
MFAFIKNNKTIATIAATILLVFVLFPSNISSAAINKQINYQGKLTNSSGVAVTNGTYNMEFKLYTIDTGGVAIWTETRIDANKVQVTSGLFSVLLGEVTALTSVDFNQTLYLGVNIGGTGTPGWDGEMTPRKKLGAVPTAILSESAINIIGGVAGAVPYQSATDTTLFSAAGTTGQALISGGTNSPTWFAPTAGSILFAGASGILAQDNSNFFWDNTNKRLGIGTTAPLKLLSMSKLAGDAVLRIENTGNGNSSGIDFIRERQSGTGQDGGSIFIDSDTATNNALLYIQAQSASVSSGVTGALAASNGVRLLLRGGTGIFSIENGATESMRIVANGNVGIGTTNPGVKLSLGTGTGAKLGVYENGTSLYGFGIGTAQLQIGSYTNTTNENVAFGHWS